MYMCNMASKSCKSTCKSGEMLLTYLHLNFKKSGIIAISHCLYEFLLSHTQI